MLPVNEVRDFMFNLKIDFNVDFKVDFKVHFNVYSRAIRKVSHRKILIGKKREAYAG